MEQKKGKATQTDSAANRRENKGSEKRREGGKEMQEKEINETEKKWKRRKTMERIIKKKGGREREGKRTASVPGLQA